RGRDARLETRRALQERGSSRVLRQVKRQGRPYFSASTWEVSSGRHDPDDRERLAVELNSLPDDLLTGPEATLPQSIADQRNMLLARHVLIGAEHSAELRGQTNHAAEIG